VSRFVGRIAQRPRKFASALQAAGPALRKGIAHPGRPE